MTPEQKKQWREELRKSNPIGECGPMSKMESIEWAYIEARKKAQEEIDRLSQRNSQLEGFCDEFVYGEENPDYYRTMDEKIKERDEKIQALEQEIEKLNKQNSTILAAKMNSRINNARW